MGLIAWGLIESLSLRDRLFQPSVCLFSLPVLFFSFLFFSSDIAFPVLFITTIIIIGLFWRLLEPCHVPSQG